MHGIIEGVFYELSLSPQWIANYSALGSFVNTCITATTSLLGEKY